MPLAAHLLRDIHVQRDEGVLVQGTRLREPAGRVAEMGAGNPIADQIDADAVHTEAGGGRVHSIRQVLERHARSHIVAAVAVDVQPWIEPHAGGISTLCDFGARLGVWANPGRPESGPAVGTRAGPSIPRPEDRISKFQLRLSILGPQIITKRVEVLRPDPVEAALLRICTLNSLRLEPREGFSDIPALLSISTPYLFGDQLQVDVRLLRDPLQNSPLA